MLGVSISFGMYQSFLSAVNAPWERLFTVFSIYGLATSKSSKFALGPHHAIAAYWRYLTARVGTFATDLNTPTEAS